MDGSLATLFTGNTSQRTESNWLVSMLYLTMLDNYETTSSEAGNEHLEGMIHVRPEPPKNLEDPEVPDHVLTIDLVTVDISPDPKPRGMKGWNRLKGKTAHWDNADWKIAEVQPIENGDSCFVWIERLSP